jgi:hypothetical protein
MRTPISTLRGRFGRVAVSLAGTLLALAVVAVAWSATYGASPAPPVTKPAVDAAYATLANWPVSPAPKLGPNAVPQIPTLASGAVDQPGPYATLAAGAGTIVQSNLGPPGVMDAFFNNGWYEVTGSQKVEVYAGGLIDSPTQGLAIVATFDTKSGAWLSGGRYLAPTNVGALTVVGATGEQLKMQGSSGTVVTFDPRTGTFS